MRKIAAFALYTLCLMTCTVYSSSAALAASTGTVMFTAEGRSYQGSYFTAEKLISVDIDGLIYKGYYASHAEDSGGVSNGISAGKWGRAFLFASSAKILRCQLESAFPKATGQCQGADGRVFRLTSGTQQKTASAPKLPAAK